jgi:hypothetical protein
MATSEKLCSSRIEADLKAYVCLNGQLNRVAGTQETALYTGEKEVPFVKQRGAVIDVARVYKLLATAALSHLSPQPQHTSTNGDVN